MFQSSKTIGVAVLFVVGAGVTHLASAQGPNPPLATYGSITVTQADYEASILRIPERDRFGFAMSMDRIGKEIDNLMRLRVLAADARQSGLDSDPSFKMRMTLYEDRLLAEAIVAKVEQDANKEFDTKRSAFEDSARERYLINKSTYVTQPQIHASHLLLTTKTRTGEQAQALLQEIRKKVEAGASFEQMAVEHSEDPTAKANKGDLGFFTSGQMDPAFESAAFGLKSPGEIAGPVQSRFGYHLIRLQERKDQRQMTFDEVKPDLMEKLRADFVENKRNQYMKQKYDTAQVKWNEPAVSTLKKTLDPALTKQAIGSIK